MTATAQQTPEVGQPAPDFALYDTAGNLVHLSDFRGKNVVLFFFPKAFTGTCERQISTHAQEIDTFTALNAVVLGVSTDQSPSQAAFARQCDPGGKVRLLSDFRHRVVNLYGVGVPEGNLPNQRATFIIDRNGTLRYRYIEPAPSGWQGIAPELEVLRQLQG